MDLGHEEAGQGEGGKTGSCVQKKEGRPGRAGYPLPTLGGRHSPGDVPFRVALAMAGAPGSRVQPTARKTFLTVGSVQGRRAEQGSSGCPSPGGLPAHAG